jgi:hypothetical protein
MELVTLLEQQPEVETISYHLNYFGILNTLDGASELVMIRGIDPERENKINTFFTKKLGQIWQLKIWICRTWISSSSKAKLDVGGDFTLSTVTSDG